MELLQITWFFLLAILFIGYAVLDGFDFGVGILHIFTRSEKERRININAIGPVWDGNEVWLVTAGGAMFAAFPQVYATVFSGFYLALMLLLLALISRAVSLEFRGKVDSDNWRKVWDGAFAFGSILPAVLFGVAFGNIIRGIPLAENGYYSGTFWGLLNPYAILVGLLSLVMCVMHGTLYLTLKTGNEFRPKYKAWTKKTFIVFVALYLLVTIYSGMTIDGLFSGMVSNPLFYIFLILLVISLYFIPVSVRENKFGRAFLASSLSIISIISLASISLFPRLVPAINQPELSLTIFNASSSRYTLATMLIIALVGMPLVIGYTIFIYRAFKGKVEITGDSY